MEEIPDIKLFYENKEHDRHRSRKDDGDRTENETDGGDAENCNGRRNVNHLPLNERRNEITLECMDCEIGGERPQDLVCSLCCGYEKRRNSGDDRPHIEYEFCKCRDQAERHGRWQPNRPSGSCGKKADEYHGYKLPLEPKAESISNIFRCLLSLGPPVGREKHQETVQIHGWMRGTTPAITFVLMLKMLATI